MGCTMHLFLMPFLSYHQKKVLKFCSEWGGGRRQLGGGGISPYYPITP